MQTRPFLTLPLCLSLVLPAPGWSAAPASAFDSELAQAQAAAKQSFLSHKPGQPYADAAAKLPLPPDDAQKRLSVEALKTLLAGLRDVQEGCALPCRADADVAVYAGKISMLANEFGVVGASRSQAQANYMPGDVPRKKTGRTVQSEAARALEAEVISRMLSNPVLPLNMREGLNQKALGIASALGRTAELKMDSDGLVTVAPGVRRALTADELKQLNAIPGAQASYLRKLVMEPPSLTPEQKQKLVIDQAGDEYRKNPGTVGEAYNFWDREAKDKNSGWLWRTYSKVNKGLLTFSGLRDVEESAARLGWVWDNADVGKGQKVWMGAKLGGNMALSTMTFLPVASMAGSLGKTKHLYTVSKGGAPLAQLGRAVPGAVGYMDDATRGLQAVVTKALPQGKKVAAEKLPGLVDDLGRYANQYGLKVKVGGVVGESTAKGGTIVASLKTGAHHEVAHLFQQVQTRALMLEREAARLGKTVDTLSDAQRLAAYGKAEIFEAASYAQHEMQALRATGFMGRAGSKYTGMLLQNADDINRAVQGGTVLGGTYTWGQRAYGASAQLLGHSQFQIGANLSPIVAGVFQVQKDKLPSPVSDTDFAPQRPKTAP
jgi:hypothetical protein